MNSFFSCIAAGFMLTAQLSCATVYQWTDNQGGKHYSDTKQPDAAEYKLVKNYNYSYHVVKKVYDGDTILLADGRKIRLLGINTPEVEHGDKQAQAGGEAAKRWLTEQLKGKKVRLEFDQEKQDKYGRYLAHLFTEQGTHINRELVRQGFASVNIFPPNLKYISELLAAEQRAETQSLGLWQYLDYAPKPASQLTRNNKQGWQRIYGRVTEIKKTRKNIYLKFSDDFKVGINKQYWRYFEDIEALQGKNIEVRGWVKRYKNGFSMWVKHPGVIKVR